MRGGDEEEQEDDTTVCVCGWVSYFSTSLFFRFSCNYTYCTATPV